MPASGKGASMKPHIYKFRGLWLCCTRTTEPGIGYTPAQAYADWKAQL